MIPDWWQAEINRWGGGYEGAPPLLGFSTVSAAGVAEHEALVKAGKTWYVYPDSGISKTGGGAGAEGPYTLAEAQSRQRSIRASGSMPHTITYVPASQPEKTNPQSNPVVDAASNLAKATQPSVPNFVQPYQNVTRGFGAYGERDIF